MAYRHKGMVEDHPGAGKNHDRPNSLPHLRPIAMHLAVGAEGFRLHKGASVTALPGIPIQGGALGAKSFPAVMFLAVQGDHLGNELLFPLPLGLGPRYFHDRKYYVVSLLVLLEAMLPFFLIFEGRKPQARELVILAVLCGLAIGGRAAFFALPGFKPVAAMVILSGVAFGGEAGFLVGAVTMLTLHCCRQFKA